MGKYGIDAAGGKLAVMPANPYSNQLLVPTYGGHAPPVGVHSDCDLVVPAIDSDFLTAMLIIKCGIPKEGS
jgi:hypothetical protein